MKNLKKVLALAVAFVMCFTMFAGAAVFSDVPVGGDYSEAITFLSDLQIIAGKPDGTFGVNDAITRADAACLIARMMTGQQNPPKYDNHVAFSDVPVGSYYEAAVGYCAALGVTSGTGGGKFSPMKTITDGEFVAMLTRALGYDTPENPLQFPMGNITVAQSKGLLDGVNIDYMSDALRGEDAQMLFNAVFADYDRAAKNKNVFQASDDHYTVTIAEEVFDLGRLSHDNADKRADSIAFHGSNKNTAEKCDVHTWVIAGVDARERENTYVAFAIDDKSEKAINPKNEGWAYQEFSYDGDIKPLLGYRVELWGEMDHSNAIWDVNAIKVLDNQSSYNYNAGLYTNKKKVKIDDTTLIINDNNNQVNLANIVLKDNWATDDKKTYRYADESGLTALKSGDAYTLADVTADLDICSQNEVNLNFADGDQYKLIDWDTDGNIDFVVRDTYKYAEVKTVSKSRLVLTAEDGKGNGKHDVADYVLKLDDDNLKVTGADGLSEGDIVEITITSRVYDKSEGGEVVTINLAKLDSESKTLEKINLTNDTYTFDGEELTFADPHLFDLVDEEQSSREEMRTKENVGQAFNIFFDKSGFMIKGNVADDSARGYLMILDTVDGNGNLNSNSKRGLAAIDVLFDDNTVQDEVPVVKDLKINAKNTGKYSNTDNGYNKSDRSWDQLQVVGNVYKYYMNEDQEITRLEEVTGEQRSDYSFDNSKDRISIRDNAVDGSDKYTSYTFASDAPIFAVRNISDGAEPAKGRGYVRMVKDEHSAIIDGTPGTVEHAVRYYVDADDVVVVNVDDMPEIDNRRVDGKLGWHGTDTWKDDDVTHPDWLLDGPISTGFTQALNNNTDKDQTCWINDEITSYQDWITTFEKKADKTTDIQVPAIAFSLNSKEEVKAAVIGVDTLDYFGASNVKLALLTDIYYHGKDVYSVDAAIDGKVANYKTIAADESDLFTDRDYESIQSYLDLNADGSRGDRNGLYAEVNMNSDGLITKIRSMDLNTVSTWSGDEKIQSTTVAEGNVYRVIRGVVTQLKPGAKNTLVTWQTSPIASNRDKYRLYDLSEFEDHNLFDHLEATYDSDTFFYKVTEKLTLTNGQPVTIKTAFKDDLGLKEADSTDLVESVFPGKATDPTSKQGSAVYYLADFAVKKAAADELVAVVAFTEELTNEGVLSDEKLGLTIGGETAKEVSIAAGESQRFALAIIGDGDLKDVEIKKDADLDTAYVAGSTGVTDNNITAKTVDNRYLDIVVDSAAATTDSAKFTVRVKGLPVATIEVTADGAASVKGFFVEVVKNTKDIKVSLSTNDENGPLVSASDIKEQGLSVTATVKKNGSDVKVKLYDIEADASGDGYFVLRPTDENAKNWEMSDVVEITVSLDGTELGTLENYKVGYNDVEYVAK
ncbi:MAG: S-layer homology domain-containing protein [Clostridiaceae bacterium]|nr:S-layer homology domain-containing protein [Clostridiaceae bacterium]